MLTRVNLNRGQLSSRMVLAALAATLLLLVSCGKVDNALPPIVNNNVQKKPLPDFTVYADVTLKKNNFFEFILPFVREENSHLQTLRDAIFIIDDAFQQTGELTTAQRHWIEKAADRYEVTNCDVYTDACREMLLRRIDIVPASLVMAQAANESAWGTSRFATEGNNLFGQWCFEEGCGLVPTQQSSGQHYEVRSFDTIHQSVRSYIMNINTHPSYRELRVIRQSKRLDDDPLNGIDLAPGLIHYSERGQAYIEEISNMIRYNQIEKYDNRDLLDEAL